MKIPEDRKKHGFDLDGYPLCERDKVKFMGCCDRRSPEFNKKYSGEVFKITELESLHYTGVLGVEIETPDRNRYWTNTWNLLKVVEG